MKAVAFGNAPQSDHEKEIPMSVRSSIARVPSHDSVPAPRGRSPLFDDLEPRRLFSGAPSVSVGDVAASEGNAGSQYAAVVVSLNARSNKTVSVNYATANGTAVAGADYDAASGKLTFAPGETTKSVLIPIRGDRSPESDESFVVRLQADKNTKIARGLGTVTILDNEPRIAFVNGVIGAYEGNSGTTPFTFDISLLAAYDQPVTVNFATSDSTAVAGEDYLAASGTLTFAPGETIKTVTVMVIGDIAIEADEAFFLNLSGPSANASLGNIPSCYASLLDDDADYSDYGGGGYSSDPWSYWPGYAWY
jgi:large repetitive protein